MERRNRKPALREPSTWAGFSALGVLVASFFPEAAPVIHAVAAVSGALAVALPEGR
jgi:hypothetical protein